jgi:hypothetical protein
LCERLGQVTRSSDSLKRLAQVSSPTLEQPMGAADISDSHGISAWLAQAGGHEVGDVGQQGLIDRVAALKGQ